jgi:hypothetical protein
MSAADTSPGAVGYLRDTLMTRADPSGQNIIPGILQWLEMDDLVGLCAPHPAGIGNR